MPRTAHILGTVLPAEAPAADRLRLNSTWVKPRFFRAPQSHAFFGRSEHELVLARRRWRRRAENPAQNDTIPTMLDGAS